MPCFKASIASYAFFAVAVSLVGNVAAQPLAIQFKNDSGLPNSQVYIGFVGPTELLATNVATGK